MVRGTADLSAYKLIVIFTRVMSPMPVSKPVRHHHRCESPRERACFTGSSNPRFSAAICSTRSHCSDVRVDIAKQQRGPE